MDKAYRLPNTNRQTHPCCVDAVRPCMVLDACPYWPTPPHLMESQVIAGTPWLWLSPTAAMDMDMETSDRYQHGR